MGSVVRCSCQFVRPSVRHKLILQYVEMPDRMELGCSTVAALDIFYAYLNLPCEEIRVLQNESTLHHRTYFNINN